MINEYIQIPYIILPWGLVQPALIITIFYVILLGVLVLFDKSNNKLRLIIRSTEKQGDKNRIIISTVSFFIMVVICIGLNPFLCQLTTLMKIFDIYLKLEPILYICVFLFLFTTILNKSNRDKQIVAANKILCILIWISVGTGLVTKQIECSFFQNKIIILLAWLLVYLELVIQIDSIDEKIIKSNRIDMISYKPIDNLDDLFPLHKIHAQEIVDIIVNSSSQPLSICVSSEWGSGKTSVVNGVKDILEKKDGYDFIFINALELDNKDFMIKYLFSQIKNKLESRGVYVGFESEFKEFSSSLIGNLTYSSIGAYIQKKISNNDYRFQKEQLEKVLNNIYKNGKLIVVVDDIERCDKNIAKEYLFLIKEVATMKNCVSIFITDYDMLNNLVGSGGVPDEELSHKYDFLNKFFNYRIDLRKESPKNIFEFYDRYFKEEYSAFNNIHYLVVMPPETWYKNVQAGIEAELEKEEERKKQTVYTEESNRVIDKSIANIERKRALFYNLTTNSRNVVKFYNVFRNNVNICYRLLSLNVADEDTKKYITTRNIGQVLYLLSFAEAFLQDEYRKILRQGAKYLNSSSEKDGDEKALLIDIFKGMVYGEYTEYNNLNYFIKGDINIFIDEFLNKNENLSGLINGFKSIEEKWLSAIEKSDEVILKEHWSEIVLMVLRKIPDENSEFNNEWRNKTILKLLKFAESQIEIGNWSIDIIFKIFKSNMKVERYLSVGAETIKTITEFLMNSKLYKKLPKVSVDEITVFANHYVYYRIGYIYRLAHYLIPLENQDNNLKGLQEYMLDTTKKYSENMNIFLDKIVQYIPEFSFDCKNCFEKYEKLSHKIEEYLITCEVADYSDIKNEIELMKDSLNEFRYLEQIIYLFQNDFLEYGNNAPSFTIDNLNNVILYFKEKIDNYSNENYKHIDEDFVAFFKWLQLNQTSALEKEQNDMLHDLVTAYVEKSGYSSLPYRKRLINISQRPRKIRKVNNNVCKQHL